MNNEQSENKSIDTGGGAFVGGNVQAGGDFVGRDKIVHGDEVRGHKAGGDVIVTTIGAGARNVAAGKNVQQQIGESESADEAPSAEELDAQFERLMAAISASALSIEQQAKAEARVELIQEEFSKAASGEEADANMICKQGDWLLANAAPLAPALRKFFTNATVRQTTLQAGEQAATWWQVTFGR